MLSICTSRFLSGIKIRAQPLPCSLTPLVLTAHVRVSVSVCVSQVLSALAKVLPLTPQPPSRQTHRHTHTMIATKMVHFLFWLFFSSLWQEFLFVCVCLHVCSRTQFTFLLFGQYLLLFSLSVFFFSGGLPPFALNLQQKGKSLLKVLNDYNLGVVLCRFENNYCVQFCMHKHTHSLSLQSVAKTNE